jgi:hypothetical protein
MAVTRAGSAATVATAAGNYWANVFYPPIGPAKCGLHLTISVRSYEALAPDTYTFRMTQGSNVVTKNFVVQACGAPSLVYRARNDQYTDNFYTINPSQLADAIDHYGYYNAGIPFKLSRSNELTKPWKRYFKDAPQIEHFYTHLSAEMTAVTDAGWNYERIEGHVFEAQLAQTVPLYRLSKFDGRTSDLQHVYTTKQAEVNQYVADGWLSDGTKGYVCPPNN